MKVIAKRGDYFFLLADNDFQSGDANGVIVDLNQKKSTEIGIQKALKWGYWEEVENLDKETLSQVLSIVSS